MLRTKLFWSALGALALTWMAISSGAALADDPVVETATYTDVSFEQHLFRDADLRLRGLSAAETLHFTRPLAWELTADPELHIELSHSETLLPHRSHLTVLLGDVGIGSVRLTEENADRGKVVVRIPRDLLKDHNDLTLAVNQHYTEECEDPFDPSLWTRVSHKSIIRFHHNQRVVEDNLSSYPYPFFDGLGYGPLKLTLVGPPRVAAETVDAASLVALTFGRLTDYRGVKSQPSVLTIEEARTAALVLGTVDGNPEVRKLVDTNAIQPGAGLIRILPNPSDPTLPVLVVTALTSDGLRAAANTLAGLNVSQMIAGPWTSVSKSDEDRPIPNMRTPASAVGHQEFTFEDIRVPDRTVRGFYASPVTVPLMIEGDSRPAPGRPEVNLHYAYSAQLDTKLSTMEIQLNGITIDSVPLDRPEGLQDARYNFELPFHLIAPHSYLSLVFHLFPKDFNPCERVSDRMIWATVYDDTEVSIPRYHYARMPDLSRLRYDAWPFTLAPGGGETTILLPSDPSSDDLGAAIGLGAYLGRLDPTAEPDLRFEIASGELPVDRHTVILMSGGRNAAYEVLVRDHELASSGDQQKELRDAGQLRMSAQVGAELPAIEEIASPDGTEHAVLILKASDSKGLLSLVDQIRDPAKVVRLDGNLSLLTPDDQIRTVQNGRQRSFGYIPVTARFQVFFRRHWLLLMVLLIGAVLLFTWAARVWATQRGGEIG